MSLPIKDTTFKIHLLWGWFTFSTYTSDCGILGIHCPHCTAPGKCHHLKPLQLGMHKILQHCINPSSSSTVLKCYSHSTSRDATCVLPLFVIQMCSICAIHYAVQLLLCNCCGGIVGLEHEAPKYFVIFSGKFFSQSSSLLSILTLF